MTQLALMMGEIPRSMREPLEDASITRVQQSGSDWLIYRSIPYRGSWQQIRYRNSPAAVQTVRWGTVSSRGGEAMNGTYRKTGLRECRRLTIISLSGQLNNLNCWSYTIFQMTNIDLTYSIAAVASESTSRVMVAVPLLYVFMTHYLFHLLRMIKGTKENTERINDLGRRLFLYGVVVLFSVNFIQSTVVGAVLSWAILMTMIISHCFVFLKETGQKYHNICLLIYYSLLLAWFACVLYNYYAGSYS